MLTFVSCARARGVCCCAPSPPRSSLSSSSGYNRRRGQLPPAPPPPKRCPCGILRHGVHHSLLANLQPAAKGGTMPNLTGQFTGKSDVQHSITLYDIPEHELALSQFTGPQIANDGNWKEVNVTYWGTMDLIQ